MTQSNKTAAPKVAFVFASVTPDVAKAAAHATAKAVVKCEKAKRTLLASVAEALTVITVPLTAAQYDRQFKPYLSEGFASAVKRGDITQKTADQYSSKLKTAVLAILAKVAAPQAGETFWEFYDRAATALPSATVTQGEGDNAQTVPVWEASAKRGRKVGMKVGGKKSGGPLPGAVADADASATHSGEAGFNRSPEMAAALILTKGNEARAARLVLVLQSYAPEFDKWVGTVTTDKDKAELAKLAKAPEAKAAETVVIKPDQPMTALADALVGAQRKANQRQRKTA